MLIWFVHCAQANKSHNCLYTIFASQGYWNPHSTGRSWQSRIFSKIIPNRRRSVDGHTIWELNASSTHPLCFYYAAATIMKIWLLLVYADGYVAATLLRPWRWSYSFVVLLYPFYIESEILIPFYYDLGASTALLQFLLRFESFWPKFWIVAESPSSGMGGLSPLPSLRM